MDGSGGTQVIHVHESGYGPGMLLLCGAQPDNVVQARAKLLAEEGYAVLAMPDGTSAEEVTSAADRLAT